MGVRVPPRASHFNALGTNHPVPGMTSPDPTTALLISCPDQPGIVAEMSEFVRYRHGNILHLDQHVDSEENVFFMRMEWSQDRFAIPFEDVPAALTPTAERFEMAFTLHNSAQRPRVAIFASHESHCLYDLLSRTESGELRMDVRAVISNHEKLRDAADRFGIPFHYMPVTGGDKAEAERNQIELLERENVDTIILARYMQILSGKFAERYPNQIINIHHSFLPAFPGARPYHSAFRRGVKIIGATSHYVTEELDDGPIIAQDVVPVTHRESISDLIRHGKDLERIVLARAVWWHVERKILVYGNKTIVFD